MTPGRFDLRLYRGDSYVWRFRLWQDEDMTVPVDTHTVAARAEYRDRTAGTVVVALQVDVDETPGANVIVVSLSPDSWPGAPARGIWDLQLTWPDGAVTTVVAGDVVTVGDATDSLPPAPVRPTAAPEPEALVS